MNSLNELFLKWWRCAYRLFPYLIPGSNSLTYSLTKMVVICEPLCHGNQKRLLYECNGNEKKST